MLYTVIVKEDDEFRFKLSIPTFDPQIKITKIAEEKYEIETNVLKLNDLESLSYIDSVVMPDAVFRKTTPNECLNFGQVCNRLEIYLNDPLINIDFRSEVRMAEEHDFSTKYPTGYQVIDLLSRSKNDLDVNKQYMGVDNNMLIWSTPVIGCPVVNTSFIEITSEAILVYSRTL